MAETATASWPSAKSTPTITRSRRRTAKPCFARKPSTPPRKSACAPPKTDDEDDHEETKPSDEPEGDDDGTGEGDGDGAEEAGTGSNRSPVDESAADELRKKRQNLRRRYKIQDVIQRRQVLLVQVVKEERGNKGAALTTYLSLAGRYCVLMPNTSHGGGISRKISNGADRKRLKSIMADLNLPKTMGLIVRTAGLSRTKTEIKRDFDYLARLWDEIRERTLKSSAPALIYRDSDLIKRAIRDLYHRDIDEVIVEGEDGYKAARGFMKLLMPSHVRRVKQYSEPTPLFQRYGVEDQLSAMYQPVVQLKSGGYLVINPTEALVSIDINSGRSTREHNIEQTAFATNLEAAHEIARQLRLRDMAGLIVIDFIDMEQSSHVRKVEKAMKEALKNDRARIQVGRISSFGLMEMSRQRLRTGVLEASTKPCPHCEGTGLMRTASSAGLSALRIIEDEAARGRGEKILLRAGREAAIYVLNKKRAELAEIEERYGVSIEVAIDESFEGARMTVESSGPKPGRRSAASEADCRSRKISKSRRFSSKRRTKSEEEEEEEAKSAETSRAAGGDRPGRRRRRRRRGGRGRGRRGGGEGQAERRRGRRRPKSPPKRPLPKSRSEAGAQAAVASDRKRRRRRGKRGAGRRRSSRGRNRAGQLADGRTPIDEEPPIAEIEAPAEAERSAEAKRRLAPRLRRPSEVEPSRTGAGRGAAGGDAEDAAPAKPARTPRSKKAAAAEPERPPNSALPSADNDERRRRRAEQARAADGGSAPSDRAC